MFASPLGKKALTAYYHGIDITEMKTGESINTGRSNISFIETKMLHWPDSMVTYLDSEKLLFSQDAFGMHLAGSRLYADEYEPYVLEYEARKYYANILNHLSPRVEELLDSLPGLNLDIRMIAPDHGPLWRRPEDIKWILDLYRECSEQLPKPRAVVVYSTMWHSTELLADALSDGIRSAGIEVKVMDLQVTDRSEVMTEVTNCGLVAFGTPTMNNQMFPDMADILCYVKGLRPKNKIGFAFGSFGWSGEGAKQIAAELEAMGAEQPFELFQVKYMPTAEDMKRMSETGEKLGRLLLERVKNNTETKEKCK
ncbi:Rubredoxin-oxygen oxidoreductase [bioreactor metagenome]|uniref:Rubredoxin-oxygen oxidoreductase n=1 Tax=bioreactor metagenome TaxID=1076179 RepID=A0A645C8F1_9ZZZZ